VSLSYLNDTITGITLGKSAFTTLTFSWTQEVPYPGKLRLAGEVARRESEMSRSRLDAAELDVAAAVKASYADLYRIDRSADILGASRRLLLSFLDAARARYETGEGILENVLRAQSEVTKLDADLQRLKQERTTVQSSLNALAGRMEDRPLGEARALPGPTGDLDAEALVASALSRSPEILESESAVRRDEVRLDLARRQLKPDLIWGAAYSNRGDLDPMVAGTFGIRLPLHRDLKQAQAIARTESETEASRRDTEEVRLGVAARVRDLAARAARAEAIAGLYREGLIPQSQSALDSAAAAYGVGRADFLTLLSDFSTALSYSIDYETQRAEEVSVLAALERLTGRELVLAGDGALEPMTHGADDE
jgi:outer membrane protein TolC